MNFEFFKKNYEEIMQIYKQQKDEVKNIIKNCKLSLKALRCKEL
jgi:hypothetical protein